MLRNRRAGVHGHQLWWLNEDELQVLDGVSALPPEYPGWMLAMQGQYRAKLPEKV